MTPEEFRASLVRAGIIGKDGKLTPPYARPEEEVVDDSTGPGEGKASEEDQPSPGSGQRDVAELERDLGPGADEPAGRLDRSWLSKK